MRPSLYINQPSLEQSIQKPGFENDKSLKFQYFLHIYPHRSNKHQPEQGALSARIIYLGSKELKEVPLTVAPPISIVEADLLKGGLLPRLDLNGDGENTWKDDYILVANILGQTHKAEEPD